MKLSAPYHELLGDLSDVPADYIRDVSHIKRFLERWTMDPKYQEAFAGDAEAALTALGVSLTPADVLPLIDAGRATEATRLVRSGRAAEVPAAVLRYRAFVQEKIDHRTRLRTDVVPADPRLRAWRDRMISRCTGELGRDRAEQIVHAPAAIELSKGCTVGCWFCGVAAPKFEHTWPYTPDHATLWRECLGVLGEVYGPSVRHGFLYWATDPLDNRTTSASSPTSTTCSGSARRPPPRRGRRTSSGPGRCCGWRRRWVRPSTGSRSSRSTR